MIDLLLQKLTGDSPEPLLGVGDEELIFRRVDAGRWAEELADGQRRGFGIAETERWLAPILNYDPKRLTEQVA